MDSVGDGELTAWDRWVVCWATVLSPALYFLERTGAALWPTRFRLGNGPQKIPVFRILHDGITGFLLPCNVLIQFVEHA
jgi:hypothetical protein